MSSYVDNDYCLRSDPNKRFLGTSVIRRSTAVKHSDVPQVKSFAKILSCIPIYGANDLFFDCR